MASAYDLSRLGPAAFEHLVNALALKVLGAGYTTFAPGADGGRDGWFSGESNYPSAANRWTGTWVIQSKFHAPHLSKDPQRWLLDQIRAEIKAYQGDGRRVWPDNWIVATNIDPSGAAQTGAFDRALAMVKAAYPPLADRFHIWGGTKILDLLQEHSMIARHYADFLMPGDVLAQFYDSIGDAKADVQRILWHLTVSRMEDEQFSKLEQAGADTSTQPGVHEIFVDLPIGSAQPAIATLLHSSARNHCASADHPTAGNWRYWQLDPGRAPTWFMRGGPGQGKSTITRYFAQVQRAALILAGGFHCSAKQLQLAGSIREAAEKAGHWPEAPRVPVIIDLKDFAQWLARREEKDGRRIINYLADQWTSAVGQPVLFGTIWRALQKGRWFVVFDGLDEVPHDVKSVAAGEVRRFLEKDVVEIDADVLTCLTSRPQGYAGEFSSLECADVVLPPIDRATARLCAASVLSYNRSQEDAQRSMKTLDEAMEREPVLQLMTTPLQAHIMAIVVREGGKPPERRWQLYRNFYEVIRRREANHGLPDAELTAVLRDKQQLLKAVHNRLGFVLHALAERSLGAQTRMARAAFEKLVRSLVLEMEDGDVERTVRVLMDATTERLVLVNTPDSGDHVRFDVRQLQEFFAAEYLVEDLDPNELSDRVELLDGDAHWREVLHFLFSGVVEARRQMELPVIVGAIEHFDRGEKFHLLARRLCRGSLAVARLLEEGVLDQDKRVRERFRAALRPAFGSTEIPVLQSLLRLRRPALRNWLRDVAIEAVVETSGSEHVGAAIVVAGLLEEGNPEAPRVERVLQRSPATFKALFAEKLAVLGLHCPLWASRFIFSLVATDDFRSLTTEGLQAVIRTLGRDLAKALQAAVSAGFDSTATALLEWLLRSYPYRSPNESHKIVRLTFPTFDWTRGLPGEPITRLASEAPPAATIPRLLHAVIRFGAIHSPAELRQLAAIAGEVPPRSLVALPLHVRAHFPIDWHGDIAAQLATLAHSSDKSLQALLAEGILNGKPVGRLVEVVLQGGFEEGDWRRLAATWPTIALRCFSERLWREARLQLPRGIFHAPQRSIISALLASPEHLLNAPGLWGRILPLAGRKETALRRKLLSVADAPVRKIAEETEFHPFHLDLPDEAALLPHLVPPLFAGQTPEQIQSLGTDFVLRVGNLWPVIDDASRPPAQRLAAHLLSWVHPDGTLPADTAFLRELCTAETLPWFLPAFGHAVRLLGLEHGPVRRLLNDVLEIARDEYAGRSTLDPVLETLRETSSAPVSSASLDRAGLVLLPQ